MSAAKNVLSRIFVLVKQICAKVLKLNFKSVHPMIKIECELAETIELSN